MDGQLARQANVRMVLGIATVKDWELRQLDVDMAYLEANVKEELYIELPENYRNSCDCDSIDRRVFSSGNVFCGDT